VTAIDRPPPAVVHRYPTRLLTSGWGLRESTPIPHSKAIGHTADRCRHPGRRPRATREPLSAPGGGGDQRRGLGLELVHHVPRGSPLETPHHIVPLQPGTTDPGHRNSCPAWPCAQGALVCAAGSPAVFAAAIAAMARARAASGQEGSGLSPYRGRRLRMQLRHTHNGFVSGTATS
jgi:hypothetical protein